MNNKYSTFATQLVKEMAVSLNNCSIHPDNSCVLLFNNQQEKIALDLTPFSAPASDDNCSDYFQKVKNVSDLITAYQSLKNAHSFEESLPEAMQYVDAYALTFTNKILNSALQVISEENAQLIASFVKNLDAYTAMKSIESLLYSRSDLLLLQIAKQNNWNVHFDHVAIRCGDSKNKSALRIAKFLIKHYGYSHPTIPAEVFYQFKEGWSAYPLYKILTNGQVLRIFIDQSDESFNRQIIQHWNHIYGYTAHHLALRVTHRTDRSRQAVSLETITENIMRKGGQTLTATGQVTSGLLCQVFSKPEKNNNIPMRLLNKIKNIDEQLPEMIKNAKLLEIVSRKEMPEKFASSFFSLYDIEYDKNSSLQSAPLYCYFLPVQAAHVINTSTDINQ